MVVLSVKRVAVYFLTLAYTVFGSKKAAKLEMADPRLLESLLDVEKQIDSLRMPSLHSEIYTKTSSYIQTTYFMTHHDPFSVVYLHQRHEIMPKPHTFRAQPG